MTAMLQVCNYPGSQFRVQGSRFKVRKEKRIRCYNVSGGQFHTMSEIIGTICDALGRKPPLLSVPVGTVRFSAGLMEDTFQLVGRKSPIGRDTIDKYTEDIAVDSRPDSKGTGF